MVPCICIDAKNKPTEIPNGMWISEGFEYHITHVYFLTKQQIQGVLLQEVKLKGCKPYETYRLNRFAFTQEALEKLIELIKACTELNHIDVAKLVEECQLTTIENR
ncbi:MAG: hypothetical protein K0S44_250 [Bacteroidetes bacterium]|jgi:hypothetical protein|nr:hypothetical protein [Bacteroidota bacterium]